MYFLSSLWCSCSTASGEGRWFCNCLFLKVWSRACVWSETLEFKVSTTCISKLYESYHIFHNAHLSNHLDLNLVRDGFYILVLWFSFFQASLSYARNPLNRRSPKVIHICNLVHDTTTCFFFSQNFGFRSWRFIWIYWIFRIQL